MPLFMCIGSGEGNLEKESPIFSDTACADLRTRLWLSTIFSFNRRTFLKYSKTQNHMEHKAKPFSICSGSCLFQRIQRKKQRESLKERIFIKIFYCRLFYYECLLSIFPFSCDTILKRTCFLHRELIIFFPMEKERYKKIQGGDLYTITQLKRQKCPSYES